MKTVLTCVGTRPNFIKITQLPRLFSNLKGFRHLLLHTGQHFDQSMSQVFFDELQLPKPDIYLGATGKTQIQLISVILRKLEPILEELKPDLVLVPGDVNSSMACALAANRAEIPIGHIESGLRSFDRTMPEEINRIIIDDLSDLFLVTEQSGHQHLLAENKDEKKIHFVGNTMIDTLIGFQEKIHQVDPLKRLHLNVESYYGLVTFHRPSNVDQVDSLQQIVDLLKSLTQKLPIVFPVHPRTEKSLRKFQLWDTLSQLSNLYLTPSLGYLDFMHLIQNAKAVVTDSGGIQEETTYLGVPCLTVRPNTERPSTVELGTNTLVELGHPMILKLVDQILDEDYKRGTVPPLWDGKASERLVEVIKAFLT